MDEGRSVRFMRRALSLARRGRGRVEPNPMVGAVLVRGGQMIAEGYHRRFGAPHAEIEALEQCRRRGIEAGQCRMFVTLEPCDHDGKTPPCTDALIRAGIGRVVVAMVDPSSTVAGRGIDRLRCAGANVEVGLCGPEAQQLNEPYVKRVTTGYPWVIAKWAQTLDGRIATRGGDSRWISSPSSRRLVHQLRARVDAVVVGVNTVLADNPRLTARGVKVWRTARRVVIDPRLRLPADALLLGQCDGGSVAAVTIAVNERLYADRPARLDAMESLGVEFLGLPASRTDPSRLALRPLFQDLVHRHAATNVLVEGGSKLMGALWQERLVDQVLVFIGPQLLGDADAVPAVQGLVPACDTIGQAPRLSLRSVNRVGEDVMLDYRAQRVSLA